MRFPNEYSFFKERYPKFYPVYIENMAAEIAASKDTHPSEAYLKELAKKAPFKISNNSSLAEFQKLVKEVVGKIL
jgi:hypothetical protein